MWLSLCAFVDERCFIKNIWTSQKDCQHAPDVSARPVANSFSSRCKTRAGKHFNGYFDRKLRNGREIFLSTSKLVFRREKKWPANKMAKMPIYWHFWKSGYCTFPMKTNDTAEIRRTHRWIICMFKVLPTFRSGSNSTYTPRKSHSERPVTHGTHFFGIYTKNRADRCSRVVKDRCNTPSPKIPKYDNTPP